MINNKENNTNEILTNEYLVKIKSLLDVSGFVGLNVSEVRYFAGLCKELNLNPFKKEIYAVPFKKADGSRSVQAIVGYETYLNRAYSSPRFYRYEKSFSGDGINLSIHLKVFDIQGNLMWESDASIKEFAKMDMTKSKLYGMWAQIPKLMLEKCMVVRATRFVVPSVVGDLPYTNEEMLKVDGFGKDNKNTNYIETKNIETKLTNEQILEGLKKYAK